jgi:hypothetical protein
VEEVEGLRVFTVQALHPGRKIRVRRLDDQVVMVRQQAVPVEPPAVARAERREHPEKRLGVPVVDEDALSSIAS